MVKSKPLSKDGENRLIFLYSYTFSNRDIRCEYLIPLIFSVLLYKRPTRSPVPSLSIRSSTQQQSSSTRAAEAEQRQQSSGSRAWGRKGNYAECVGASAPVYWAAVMECPAAAVLSRSYSPSAPQGQLRRARWKNGPFQGHNIIKKEFND